MSPGSLCKECLLSTGQELFPKTSCFQGGEAAPIAHGQSRGPGTDSAVSGSTWGPHGPPGGHRSGEYPCEAGRCDSPVFWRNLFSDFPVYPVILSDIASKELSNICLSFSHFFLHPAYSCSSADKWHLTSSLCIPVQCCKCQFMKRKIEKERKKEGGREREGGKKEGKKEREREK